MLNSQSFPVARSFFAQNLFLILLASVTVYSGCAGYQVGNQTLYNTNIRTIYVPMVKSNSLRPHLAERLTEAVVKELERRTPYKVARDNQADAVLNVELVDYNQGIDFKDKWGGPRQEKLTMSVKIELVDRRSMSKEQQTSFALSQDDVAIFGQGSMIAVAGQSTSTEQQQAIDRLAMNIVNSLEKPW